MTSPQTGQLPDVFDSTQASERWIFHYFTDDLRRILKKELPRIRRNCTAEEMRCISELVERIHSFCRSGTFIPPATDGPSPENASPSQHFLHELRLFCRDLSKELEYLTPADRRFLRAELTRVFRPQPSPLSIISSIEWLELAIAGCSLIAWVILFAIGYAVHAGPYEDVIKEPRVSEHGIPEVLEFSGALSLFIMSSIPTNVLLLSCLAGCLGTAFRRAVGRSDPSLKSRSDDYVFSMTASFFIYIILIGGLLTLSVADILTNETQEKHLKLAGTASMCAFLVGYDRQLLASLLQRAASFMMQSDVSPQPGDTKESKTIGREVDQTKNRATTAQPEHNASATAAAPQTCRISDPSSN